jgi:methyl-accepting chemotaxis protein
MKTFHDLKIKHKMFLPNVLNITLLVLIVFFFTHSNAIIKEASYRQRIENNEINSFQNVQRDIKDYINNKITYQDLKNKTQSILRINENKSISSKLNTILENIRRINVIRIKNIDIDKNINELADNAILQSNSYIKSVIKQLTDSKKKAGVSDLEIMVIGGADNNTSLNYQMKVLFARMKGDLNQRKALLDLIAGGLQNVVNDAKHLAGTPFAPMVNAAHKDLLKIQELANSYIQNVDAQNVLLKTIDSQIKASSEGMQKAKRNNSEKVLDSIKGYFRSMLVMILVVTLLGMLISLLSFKSVLKALVGIIQGLSGASREVDSAAGQLSGASQALAEGASEQASSIEQISASLEQMSAVTKGNAQSAGDADTLMQEVKKTFESANASMGRLTSSMEEISQASEQTSKIIKTIDEIAFQTNLLALNAAVEAARAGEAGAGFAVVADEVRNLAMRAAEAAKNTASLIEGTVKKVKEGSGLVTRTSEAFSGLGNSTAKIASIIAEIAGASKEQSMGIEQVSSALNSTEQVIEKNSANAEQTSAASQEMRGQAEQMKKLVGRLVALVGGNSENLGDFIYADNAEQES